MDLALREEPFTVYVDRLAGEKREKIQETYSPSFLDIDDEDFLFDTDVVVSGEAFLSQGNLVLQLSAKTEVKIPCSVCNEQVTVPVKLNGFVYSPTEEEISSGVYNFSAPLREAILLETPLFAECNGGRCSSRQEMEQYLKAQGVGEVEFYQPFSGVNLKEIEKKIKDS